MHNINLYHYNQILDCIRKRVLTATHWAGVSAQEENLLLIICKDIWYGESGEGVWIRFLQDLEEAACAALYFRDVKHVGQREQGVYEKL